MEGRRDNDLEGESDGHRSVSWACYLSIGWFITYRRAGWHLWVLHLFLGWDVNEGDRIPWDRAIFFFLARDLDGALELASLSYRGVGDGIRNFYTYIRSFDMI